MLRSFTGVVVGLLVGLGLGFVLFNSAGGRGAPGQVAPSLRNEVRAQEAPEPALLSAGQSVLLPQSADSQPELLKSRPVSEKRVQEALARVALSPSKTRRGEQEIWGRVLDAEGNGIGGVLVRAIGNNAKSQFKDPNSAGKELTPTSLEETVRVAAQNYQDLQARRYQGLTDSEGDYRLQGLPDGSFRMQAFREGFTLTAESASWWGIPSGNELNFTAAQLVNVTIQIKMPDGSNAETALVETNITGDNSSRAEMWAWTPESKVLHLAATKVTLTAYSGIPDFLGRIGNSASLRSEPQTLELGTGAPQEIEFQLASRLGIRGQVSLPKDIVSSRSVQVHLMALGDAGEVNLDLLSNSQPSHQVQNLGDFAFLELEPGAYAVGLAREWNGPIEVYETIQVSEGIARCRLIMPPVDLEKYLVVSLAGPGGEALKNAQFSILQTIAEGGGSSSRGLRGLSAEDGRHLLTIPKEFSDEFYGKSTVGISYGLNVTHNEFGTQQVFLSQGQTQAEIQYAAPAQLQISIAGLSGGEFVGRISLSISSTREGTMRSYSNNKVGPSGIFDFKPQAPGEYKLDLTLTSSKSGRRSNSVLASQIVHLKAGPNSAHFSIPTLYSLEITVPDGSPKVRVGMAPFADGKPTNSYRRVFNCNTAGMVSFEDLAPGQYTISAWGTQQQGSMVITVPSGPVMYTPDKK